ncbi:MULTISPECIES: PGF-CTERM sorting domain-containing protein [Haloferax]|uniref:PGF-CTERM sorting domain-containing protein n=2 Tax=Haloferax TaxID=2251 RepID=A0A6G1YYB6_9EURY|nr:MULTISPECIES: PGF-CTERM sorting domain-containing protein [Haloferax]KAB1186670.1 PGF-CTERM sorting domain-containing protein [Haloferax sp. CBA1149]MRW79290.1 PGF-CTERM sorting domain-containing protein [Haloferax marinisediminis]
MNRIAVVLAALLVTAAVPVGSVAAQQSSTDASAYTGTHVSFDTKTNAVTNYTVDGVTVVESVETSSQADASVGLDVALSAVTDVEASGLSLAATSETNATVRADSGATLRAHDNPKGTLVVSAGNESQYVTADLGANATAAQAGNSRIIVEQDGRMGAFILVGNGSVTVNEEGNVTADLQNGSRLVYRSYSDGRTDDDKQTEKLIASGSATTEVYVMQDGDETTVDAIHYDENTTVELSEQTKDNVTVTIDRSVHQGTVVVTSVSEEALAATDNLSVMVDGEAAVQASSYTELQSAANGGETSKYLVQETSAEGETNVLVAVNHFSERQVTMSGDDSSSTSDETTTPESSDDTTSDKTTEDAEATETTSGEDAAETTTSSTSAPGFGVGLTVVALAGAALVARRRA